MAAIEYGEWRDHTPGKAPVGGTTPLEIEFRNGNILGPVHARMVLWGDAGEMTCVRYRVLTFRPDDEPPAGGAAG